MLTIKQLVDLVDIHDIRRMSHIVVILSQVYVQLVIIVISHHFQRHFVYLIFLDDVANHV